MFVSDIDSMLKRWMALCVYYINDVVFFAKNYRHAWKINGNITAETHDFTPIISIYTFALIPFSLPLCHFLSHALSFLHCYHERYIRSYIYIHIDRHVHVVHSCIVKFHVWQFHIQKHTVTQIKK